MEKRDQKRLLSALILLMTAAAALGCGEAAAEENAAPVNTEPVSAPAETLPAEETEARVLPQLPEALDFDGHKFIIMNNDYSIPLWAQTDIAAEELNGDNLNDAVHNRNTLIADTYNCSIESVKTLNLQTDLSKLVRSGDAALDLATPYLRTFAVLAQDKYFLDLKTVDSLNLSNPWYDQNSVTELTVGGKLYGAATDLTTMDKQATTAMVFNKQMYGTYDFDDSYGDIYTLVRDGKWTFDALKQMVFSVSGDLDGDGKQTDKDLFGLLYQRDTLTSFLNGFGVMYAQKNADDFPEFSLMTDRGVRILDEIFDLLYEKQYCLNVMADFGEDKWSDSMVSMFADNQALFMWIRLADCANLRTLNLDFGILPVPKYDEEQEHYKSAVNSYVGAVTTIPVCCYDPEMTGYFLEAIASESRYSLLPEYYEINLKGKVSRDAESAEMLDLIFSNRLYDLGEILDPGSFANTLIYMTMTDDRNAVSKWEKTQKSASKQLEKVITKFSQED